MASGYDRDGLLEANSRAAWDRIWREEGERSWRRLMAPIHDATLAAASARLPDGPERPVAPLILELGAGYGFLARRALAASWRVYAVDISDVACARLRELGCQARSCDLEQTDVDDLLRHAAPDIVVGSEILEHLTHGAREHVLTACSRHGAPCIWTVPDDRLGPEDEPQHALSYSAETLRAELERYWGEVAVRSLSGHLLAECSAPLSRLRTRTRQIHLRATDAERARWERAAQQRAETLSDFIRCAADGRAKGERRKGQK